MSRQERIAFQILKIAAAAVFLGRAWQHLIWDAPYRALLWDEKWMGGIVRRWFGLEWEDYVTDPLMDNGIQSWIVATGWLYMVCALICLFIERLPRWMIWIAGFGAANLIFLALLYWKERFFLLPELLEYSLQWVTPLLLLWWAYGKSTRGIWTTPTPGLFYAMTMNILGVNQETARLVLEAAGWLDLLAALAIWLPGRSAQFGLSYMVLWGFATAFARIWAHWDPLAAGLFSQQWIHEFVMRFPHFLTPLALWMLIVRYRSQT